MKQRKKIINWIIVVYIAGIVVSWTAEFWRDLFKSPVEAWTALDAFPSGRDFIWPISGVRRIFSPANPDAGDYYAQAASRYRTAQTLADKDRAPTGMTLLERDAAALLFETAAKNGRKVAVNTLRTMHVEQPVRYRYQFIAALDHFAQALRENDAVLWKVAESEMAAYDAWSKIAMPAAQP
jgi:hypothetical protein